MGHQNTIAKLTESTVQPVVLGREFNSLHCCIGEENSKTVRKRKHLPAKQEASH